MKRILFALLMLIPGIAAADQTILWIPYHSAAINEIIKILEADENIKLTAAIDQVSAPMEKRLKALEEQGRLEIALRIPGDPVIPLFYYPNSELVNWDKKPVKSALPDDAPFFMGLRIGTAMENARKKLKRHPVGIVLPPGSLMKDYFPLAKSIGIKWIASGPFYESDEEDTGETAEENSQPAGSVAEDNSARQAPPSITESAESMTENSEDTGEESEETTEASIAEVNGVKVIPFTPYSEGLEISGEEFIVFDETAEEDPGPVRRALKQYLTGLSVNTRTAADIAENSVAAEIEAGEISKSAQPWTVNYDRWAARRNQVGALVAMSQTRNELMKYLNSKAGNMKEAMPAFDAYYKAENSRTFLNLGSENKNTAHDSELAMRGALTGVFSTMGKNPPSWSLSSLSDAGTGRNTAYMRIAMKNTGFEIKNDQKKPVFEQMPAGLPETVDPYKLWKLNSFNVEVKNNNYIFRFTPGAINNSGSYLSGFSHIAIDLYIDVNHRVNAGASDMLPGRPMKLSAEDSWEYALEISPNAVYLYRSTSMGPKQLGKYRARVQGGAVTVTIPGTVLRGTPRKWGYVALMMVPQDSQRFSVADTLSSRTAGRSIYAVRPSESD